MEEIELLGQLNSPYIVKYIDAFVDGSKVAIVMEYCDQGDLETYIDQKKRGLSENVIWKLFI